ncbi:hypothetical protein ACROYT_G007024 [Oculina patagonica]
MIHCSVLQLLESHEARMNDYEDKTCDHTKRGKRQINPLITRNEPFRGVNMVGMAGRCTDTWQSCWRFVLSFRVELRGNKEEGYKTATVGDVFLWRPSKWKRSKKNLPKQYHQAESVAKRTSKNMAGPYYLFLLGFS